MNRRRWNTIAIVCGLTALIAGVFTIEDSLLYGTNLLSVFVVHLARWGCWAILLPFIKRVTQSLPIKRKKMGRLVFTHSAASVIFGFVHYEMVTNLPMYFRFTSESPFVTVFSWEILTYLQLAAVCYTAEFWGASKRRELESSQLEAQIAKLQVQALQSQIQPQSLLNSLRRIQNLLGENVGKADRAIVELGDFLRTNLDGQAPAQRLLDQPLSELRGRLAILVKQEQVPGMTRKQKSVLIGVIWVSINVFFLGRYAVMLLMKEPVNWITAGWITFAWCEWAVLTAPALWLAGKYPVEKPHIITRTFLHGMFCVLFWFAVEVLFTLGIWISGPGGVSYTDVLWSNIRAFGFMTDVITYATILVVHHAIKHHRDGQRQLLKVVQLQTTLLEAQLGALQMQIHPHFLFNTLHSAAELLHEDRAAAGQMLSRLERFFRATLQTSVDQRVPLEQEIEFLQCYLDIQQVRFKDSLTVNMDVDEESKRLLVPNLILQPIVENAIRHGKPPGQELRNITIRTSTGKDSLELQVQDNGPGIRNNKHFREGLGLRNVRARLHRLYGDPMLLRFGDISDGGLQVTVDIPLRPAFLR